MQLLNGLAVNLKKDFVDTCIAVIKRVVDDSTVSGDTSFHTITFPHSVAHMEVSYYCEEFKKPLELILMCWAGYEHVKTITHNHPDSRRYQTNVYQRPNVPQNEHLIWDYTIERLRVATTVKQGAVEVDSIYTGVNF